MSGVYSPKSIHSEGKKRVEVAVVPTEVLHRQSREFAPKSLLCHLGGLVVWWFGGLLLRRFDCLLVCFFGGLLRCRFAALVVCCVCSVCWFAAFAGSPLCRFTHCVLSRSVWQAACGAMLSARVSVSLTNQINHGVGCKDACDQSGGDQHECSRGGCGM